MSFQAFSVLYSFKKLQLLSLFRSPVLHQNYFLHQNIVKWQKQTSNFILGWIKQAKKQGKHLSTLEAGNFTHSDPT